VRDAWETSRPRRAPSCTGCSNRPCSSAPASAARQVWRPARHPRLPPPSRWRPDLHSTRRPLGVDPRGGGHGGARANLPRVRRRAGHGGGQSHLRARARDRRAARRARPHAGRGVGTLRPGDIVLTSTAAPHAVVTWDRVAPAIARAGASALRPRPRHATRCGARDRPARNVFLYDIDDLQAVAAQAAAERRRDIPAAERIVSEEVDRFWAWYGGWSSCPS